MITEIVLPSGTKRVPVFVVPNLFAEALYPRNPNLRPANVTIYSKTPLTDEQWNMVKEVWPDAFLGDYDNEAGLRVDAMKEHKAEVENAIRSSELKAHFHTGIPVPAHHSDLFNTWVTVDDLREYAARFRVGVRFRTIIESAVWYRGQQIPAPLYKSAAPVGFSPELRQEIANREHWSERDLEALCFGIPPNDYCDTSVSDTERESVRNDIRQAIGNGRLYAEATGSGNPLYGGQWRIERVSAVRWAIASRFTMFPEWLASHDLKEIEARQDAERRVVGRFKLRQAADALERHTRERANVMVEKLKQAVRAGALPVYEPGKQARYQSNTVRDYYEEAYWNDLNDWLDANEPRIAWRFPKPAAPSDAVVGDGSADDCSGAVETLRRERAKPRDIAWAWQILMEIQNGEVLGRDERRFRPIKDRRDWILKLGLQTTDASGSPTTIRKGVPVSGLDDDIEDRMLVRVSEVRDAAFLEHLPWPAVDAFAQEPDAPTTEPEANPQDAADAAPAKGEPQTEARAAPKLTLPNNSDAWAKAIEATYETMVQETGGTPSDLEVWLRMNDKPPTNYPITVTKDHGLAAITMQGQKPLTHDAFTKRWKRYTAAK